MRSVKVPCTYLNGVLFAKDQTHAVSIICVFAPIAESAAPTIFKTKSGYI